MSISYDACREVLYRLNVGYEIDGQLAYDACRQALMIEQPETRHYFLSAILHGLMVAGPNSAQIINLLEASFSLDQYDPRARPLLMRDSRPTITLMGSGKKGLKTVNISTLAAIVAASSEKVIICKPCTRATSSLTGSADFMEVLGLQAHRDTSLMQEIALQTGLGVFLVNSHMPEFMKRYDEVFYAPHAMSFALAALAAPFRTEALLYGLAHPNVALSFELLRYYDVARPTVVAGSLDGVHYVDEALPRGNTSLINHSTAQTETFLFEELLPGTAVHLDSITQVDVGEKSDNVKKGLQAIKPKSESDLTRTIALNAGLILYAAGVNRTILDGYELAMDLIKQGAAWQKLRQFVVAAGGDEEIFVDVSLLQ